MSIDNHTIAVISSDGSDFKPINGKFSLQINEQSLINGIKMGLKLFPSGDI